MLTYIKKYIAIFIILILANLGIATAQESQSDVDVLKQLQTALTTGPIHQAIKGMTDSAGINVYPMFHIADDSALWPYAAELYFDVRAERKEPYLIVTLNFIPETGKWTDFASYKVQVHITQGKTKAIPLEVILPVEKQLNDLLANIGNLKQYVGEIRDNVADAIRKLRMAMMDKYWVGKNLPLVAFSPAPGSEYGFDPPVQEAIVRKYPDFYRYDTVVLAPWKSLSLSQTDKVSAYITVRDTAFKKNHIRFVNNSGVVLPPIQTKQDTLTFSLTGIAEGKEDELTAEYYENDPAGKERKAPLGQVKTITYTESMNTVHLVLVNGAKYSGNIEDLKKYLKNAYKQAVVSWDVIMEDIGLTVKDWDLDGDGKLKIETSILQRYSDEENTFINAWETANPKSDTKAAYLFIVDMPNSLNARGYMPLNANYGFIFVGGNNSSVHDEVYQNTIAHELGHGIFKLYHPWDVYGTPERQTNNLMDYQMGATLWKPQWDWIHDPGIRTYMFQSEEEGAMSINAGLLATTEEKNGVKMTSSITCLSGAGVPITLPDNIKSVEFYTKNTDISEGALVGFTTQNDDWYVGIYEVKSKKVLGYSKVVNATAKDVLERCETNKGALVYYPDIKTKELKNDPAAKVFLGFRSGCSIDVRTVPLSLFSSKITSGVNSGSGDKAELSSLYKESSNYVYNEYDERLCPCMRKLTPLTFKEAFVGYEWARYNAYGDGGILIKMVVKGHDEFYYSNQDANGNFYCYRYDFIGKGWVTEPMAQPGDGEFNATLFSSEFALKFLSKLAPTLLDMGGSIPIIGIPFNVVNGVWYAIKDEKASAVISFASCIPIEGMALIGIKYANVIIQTGKNTFKLIRIADETNLIIQTFVKNTENISKTVLDDGIKGIINLAEKYPDYRKSIKALTEQITEHEKLAALLNKVGSLDDATALEFLKDISVVSSDAEHLANNLSKVDDGIIEAWKLLDGSPIIRKGFDNLENQSKVLKSEVYKNWGTLDELKAAVNNSGSKAKLIENLSKANPASKYPIDGLRELDASWQDATKAKRFKDADEFYKTGYGTNMDKINTELRGIDFDNEVEVATIKEDEYVYQYMRADNFGNPIKEAQGNYFIKNPKTPSNSLGFSTKERILVKFKVTQDVNFLKSKASSIEWVEGGAVFSGGSEQYFIPNSKEQGIVFDEIYTK